MVSGTLLAWISLVTKIYFHAYQISQKIVTNKRLNERKTGIIIYIRKDESFLNQRERIQKRIKRDKEYRAAKKAERNEETKADNYDKVLTIQNYYKALIKCRKGVMWKGKPQKYCQTSISKISATFDYIKDYTLPPLENTSHIILYERGKKRIITPIQFSDRITQRVLCDYSMIPIIHPSLIYDNGASTEGKGTDFARKRAEKFLREAINDYGENFYILTFDFKSFFDSIPHITCYNVLNKYYTDNRIVNLIMEVVKSYQRPNILTIKNDSERELLLNLLENNQMKGICLGSQISQILALVVPNQLDHYIKDDKRMKRYVRYMDDGIIIHQDKKVLQELYLGMKEVCNILGLTFNEKKTKIVKATKGFSFLKIKYRVAGKRIIKTLVRSGIVRMRRKLKKFKKKVDCGEMKLDDVYNSMQSWLAHAKLANSYHTVKSMLKLYNDLFGGYKITKQYFRKQKRKGGQNNEILQSDKWADFRWDSNYFRASQNTVAA